MINKKNKSKVDKMTIIAIIFPIILISLDLISNTIMIGVLVFQFLILILKIKKTHIEFDKKKQRTLSCIIIFLLITYLIDLYGKYATSTIITTTLVFANIILVYMLSCYTVNKKETFIVIVKIFVVFVVFLCLYGIIIRIFGGTPKAYTNENGEKQYKQVITIKNIKLFQRAMGDSQGRFGVTSLTKNPNTFSYLILYAFIINTILIEMNKKQGRKSMLNYIYALLFLVGVYIAGSRLAIVLIPFSYITIKIFQIQNRRNIPILISSLLLLVLIAGIYFINNTEAIKQIDLNGRDELWKIMPEVMEDSLLIGQGLDAARSIVLEKTGLDLTMFNSYFTMIANYGLLITIVFYIVIVFFILKLFLQFRHETEMVTKKIYLISIILLMTGLIQGVVENNILRFSMWNIIYVFLLSISAMIKDEEKKE